MLGALYQDDTNKALDNLELQPLRPLPPLVPFKQSVWAQPIRGLARGLGEAAAGVSELAVGTYRKLQDPSAPFDGDTEASRDLRKVARGYRPDPASAGLAENVTHELFRVVPKAAAYIGAAGPVAGAVALGADEAFTIADDLREKGVDADTRMKAAAVGGVTLGASVALPLVGPTVKATLGLYALGGPGAFVAQQAATREILKSADYADLAKQYDPLDVTGLALSAVIPLPFVAWGVRANLRAKPRLAPEQVDAVMTHNLTLAQDVRAAATPDDVAKQMAKVVARERAAAPVAPEPAAAPEPTAPASPFRAAVEELAQALRGDPGQFLAELKKAGRGSPLMNNALVGVADAAGDPQRLTSLIGHAEAMSKETPARPLGDVMADAVERVRAGVPVPVEAPKSADPLIQSVMERVAVAEAKAPDMILRIVDDRPITLREELAAIRKEALMGTEDALGANDAPLLKVAADCYLQIGGA